MPNLRVLKKLLVMLNVFFAVRPLRKLRYKQKCKFSVMVWQLFVSSIFPRRQIAKCRPAGVIIFFFVPFKFPSISIQQAKSTIIVLLRIGKLYYTFGMHCQEVKG